MIKLDRIGHAYLFTGEEGIGKKLIAIAFSKAMNCTHLSKDQDPCNHCLSCQKIESGLSPDFQIISPINDSIKIDQIREIKKNIFLKPLENRKKIIIIDHADLMTIEASNSLLKILEEPPEFAVFILISAFPKALLPTILSRCYQMMFKPLEIEQQLDIITRNLPSLPIEQARNFMKIFFGSPRKAMDFFNDQDKMTFKDRFVEIITKTKPG
ncbi:MAG: DNA polymerase III subunit delta', partial [Candidatus Atribacteria bacterium]|nr:DNA polymerase III subunit delta' [Candidatus Atribacteria bacterium]